MRARRDEEVTRTAPPIARPAEAVAETAPLPEARAERAIPRRLGRYELLVHLADGGMGAIYAGRLRGPHGFDRLVAVKVMSAIQPTSEGRAAFHREARVAASIDHPNVVRTLDLGEEEGLPFLVMDLVQGASLDALLRRSMDRGKPLDPALAGFIVGQAAEGLHAAHELADDQGAPLDLVHRDVSPHNVLVSFDGRVYVTDFGIAKLAAGAETTTGVVKGKFAYLSPEQASGERLDRRSDVFALGIVLHEALTGERLFDAGSPAASVHRLMSGSPEAPHERRCAVPASLSRVAMRCLERERARRYATAREVAEALREAIRGEGLHVDERDLAEHMRDALGDERERLRERLRTASAAPMVLDEARAGEIEPGSLVVPLGPPRRRSVGVVLAIVAGALVSAFALLAGRRAPSSAPRPVAASDSPLPAASGAPSFTAPSASPEPMVPAALTSAPATSRAREEPARAAPRAPPRPVGSPALTNAAPLGPPLFDQLGP